MLRLNIQDETSQLKVVVLGTAESNGPTPSRKKLMILNLWNI